MSCPCPSAPTPAALLTNVSVLEPVSHVTSWSLCVLVVRSPTAMPAHIGATCPVSHVTSPAGDSCCVQICVQGCWAEISQHGVCSPVCMLGCWEALGVPVWVHAEAHSRLGCCTWHSPEPGPLALAPGLGTPWASRDGICTMVC